MSRSHVQADETDEPDGVVILQGRDIHIQFGQMSPEKLQIMRQFGPRIVNTKVQIDWHEAAWYAAAALEDHLNSGSEIDFRTSHTVDSFIITNLYDHYSVSYSFDEVYEKIVDFFEHKGIVVRKPIAHHPSGTPA